MMKKEEIEEKISEIKLIEQLEIFFTIVVVVIFILYSATTTMWLSFFGVQCVIVMTTASCHFNLENALNNEEEKKTGPVIDATIKYGSEETIYHCSDSDTELSIAKRANTELKAILKSTVKSVQQYKNEILELQAKLGQAELPITSLLEMITRKDKEIAELNIKLRNQTLDVQNAMFKKCNCLVDDKCTNGYDITKRRFDNVKRVCKNCKTPISDEEEGRYCSVCGAEI